MKKAFYLIIFSVTISFSAIQNSFAQITLETSYVSTMNSPVIIYFSHTSAKWFKYNQNFIYLYNLNHTLYRLISIPPQPVTIHVAYVTEDLFDTDTTNIEFMVFQANPSVPQIKFMKIYRDNGTLLFQRDSAAVHHFGLMGNDDYTSSIMATDSGVKMMLNISTPSYNRTEIYSLPGHLPCKMTCSEHVDSEGIPTGISGPAQKNFSHPYPNPSSGQTHIPYTLPDGETQGEIIFYDLTGAEVKRYKVDRTFSDLILSTADLAAGSYYYQLVTANSKSEGKKLIVIK